MVNPTVPKKLAYEIPKNAHKNAQKKYRNFKPSIHNVVSTGTNFAKNMAVKKILAVLGSQGIVVKYTGAVYFGTVDYLVRITMTAQSRKVSGCIACG